MKIIFPDYYEKFKCTASACRHNCCIGWEIDIDEESLALYRSVGGELGKRLKKNISRRGAPHFILGEGERCPFLNAENLCDIYKELGEGALCQICDDHPRFRSFWSEATEIGVGLSCEAAAELILGQTEPVRFLFAEDEEPGETAGGEERELMQAKLDMLGILQNRSLPLRERVAGMLAAAGAEMPQLSLRELAAFFLGLERLDEAWTGLLESLSELSDGDIAAYEEYSRSFECEYEQLAVYLLYRHFNGEIYPGCKSEAALLAALCLRLLWLLGAAEYGRRGELSFADRVELCRLFSAEIEYSDENVDRIKETFIG